MSQAMTEDRPPVTEARLRRDLERLGVEPGDTLTVHSSLSAIGWVLGGAPTVVRALIGCLGPDGTLAMPAATPSCADPATWPTRSFAHTWLDEVREHLPIFDPLTTPTEMGSIPETFRRWPDTRRSDHPLESVCARGPAAEEVTQEHPLAYSEGPGSPFARLHDLDSRVLLVGVGFNRCTALHLAESLISNPRRTSVRFPTLDGDRRVWVEVPNVADDNDTHFPIIGELFASQRRVRRGKIGEANCFLFSMRDLVKFARDYFETNLDRPDTEPR